MGSTVLASVGEIRLEDAHTLSTARNPLHGRRLRTQLRVKGTALGGRIRLVCTGYTWAFCCKLSPLLQA